ncbi:AraC family transcriptional regulator [Ochrobactrum anthropi]|uniref:helix-turn-helix domain-containing protein n=1 Tax=Brucella anthropi TaxID=529 RepID=UPI0015FD4AB8|nr:AraC family transcriptional regulator [Brucella anthropi]MBA8862842.1 AraC family transcriptional regulator [Brucella anthropi]
MNQLLREIPSFWGPKVELGEKALAFTKTHPNFLTMKTQVHTALVMHTPQIGRELSINSDKIMIRDVPLGSLEILPAQSEIYARWKTNKQNTLFAITENELNALAVAEFDKINTVIRPILDNGVDSRTIAIANMVRRELVTSQGNPDHLLLEALQLAFWVYTLRKHSSIAHMQLSRPKGGLTPHTLKRLEEYMHANLSQKITIANLAEIAGLSPAHFMRAYRDTCGNTVNRRLTELRLKRAAQLISNTNYPLSLIAKECGFNSNSYMTWVMKQQWTITPSEMRLKSS